MSLILIPQISGSVLPANVHQRVVYKKPQLFIIACAFAAFSPSLAWVSGAGSKYASAFSAVPEGRLYPKLRHFNRPRHRGPPAKQRAVRLGLSFAADPRRFCRILFFSLRPISVILKSLQIRLQRSECQFGKGCINARRFQSRNAALLFGDHSSRFFDMARYGAAKIIVRYHIGEPNASDLAALRILMTFSTSVPYRLGPRPVASEDLAQCLAESFALPLRYCCRIYHSAGVSRRQRLGR